MQPQFDASRILLFTMEGETLACPRHAATKPLYQAETKFSMAPAISPGTSSIGK
jgi:hypothetical protein